MRKNTIRELLNADKPSLCARTAVVWPDIVELIGSLGIYDYVEYAAEYGTFGLPDLDNYCRAAELWGLGSMIKLDQDPRMFMAQRAIGSGFESVLFVDCRTVDEVRECVAICRPDTPTDGGLFGAAGRRFAYSGGDREAFSQALRDIVVAIMMEKKALVDEIDEVLAIPGVDMIQWGPSDYGMSSGLYTQEDPSAEIKRVEKMVIEKCLAAGVAPRIELNAFANVEYYTDLGVKHFRIGHDMAVLKDFWKRNGEAMREVLAKL